MAAVQTPGTPAPAAPAPPPVETDATIERMAAAAAGEDGLASPSEPEPAAEPVEGEPAPAAAPPEPEPVPWDHNHEFTEEELATPEGIQDAAAKIRGGMKDFRAKMVSLDGRFAKFKQKEARQQATFAKWQEERELNNQATRQIFSQVEALRKGDTQTAIRALGALTGKDPIAALEELNLTIVTNGQPRARTPEEMEAEVEKRLEEKLEAKIAQREHQNRVNSLLPKANAMMDAVNPETHPEIAYLMSVDAAGVTTELLERAESEGKRPVDYPALLEDIERQLRERRNPTRASVGTGPQTPQKAPSTPAESLSPSLTSRGGSVRQKSEAELQAEAESLVPAAWLRMGRGE